MLEDNRGQNVKILVRLLLLILFGIILAVSTSCVLTWLESRYEDNQSTYESSEDNALNDIGDIFILGNSD